MRGEGKCRDPDYFKLCLIYLLNFLTSMFYDAARSILIFPFFYDWFTVMFYIY